MSDYPLRFRLIVVSILLATFVGHLTYDASSGEYDGGATTLLLLTIIGGAIGLDQLRRGGGNQ